MKTCASCVWLSCSGCIENFASVKLLDESENLKERAKESGLSMPDEPPVRGHKMRSGGGMGAGGGMGSGGGRNR